MTRLFDRLAERPRTQIDHGSLTYEERADLRQIKVTQSSDITNKGGAGGFTTVYYLEGDEHQAAEVFVEENQDQLKGIDFSKKDVVQRGVSREVYDWILHYLGERDLEKYETVVRETRPNGPIWIIDRDHYEDYPSRRYSIGETPSVRIDVSLEELYDAFGDAITTTDLETHNAIEGDVRYILEYYRVADRFECDPVTLDGAMAIQKHDS